MYTRREFGELAAGGLVLPNALTAIIDSRVGGVRLGIQTYSLRNLERPADVSAVDVLVRALTDCGVGECELWSPQIEPSFGFGFATAAERQRAREDLRTWRLGASLDALRRVRRTFDAAGIAIYAFNLSFDGSFTDEEIDRGFQMARALGAEIITSSTTLPVIRRVAPFAERHQMVVAVHNHSNVSDPNELATPESFIAAVRLSKHVKVNLDIGHFTAANYDPVAFLREHHDRITNLHLKDRKKNQGDNTPWGEGDTPIREVLRLLKEQRWPIRAYIEYEYRGAGSPTEEVKKCLAYVKAGLA